MRHGERVDIDRNGLEILDRDRAMQLLRLSAVGRIAITSGALPVILPINYQVVDDHIVFRTGAGTKLDAATRDAVVAFEVDGFDPEYHSGWSVLVIGTATEALDLPDEIVAKTPHWSPGADGRVVRISIDQLSGRRLGTDHRLTTAELHGIR